MSWRFQGAGANTAAILLRLTSKADARFCRRLGALFSWGTKALVALAPLDLPRREASL
jgi:hypothetical protein